jgi:hypothetical protein
VEKRRERTCHSWFWLSAESCITRSALPCSMHVASFNELKKCARTACSDSQGTSSCSGYDRKWICPKHTRRHLQLIVRCGRRLAEIDKEVRTVSSHGSMPPPTNMSYSTPVGIPLWVDLVAPSVVREPGLQLFEEASVERRDTHHLSGRPLNSNHGCDSAGGSTSCTMHSEQSEPRVTSRRLGFHWDERAPGSDHGQLGRGAASSSSAVPSTANHTATSISIVQPHRG